MHRLKMSDPSGRYMLFMLSGRRYAVAVEDISEISELLPEYPVPNAPPFIRGVVNIHGRVAAVLDLSLYWGGEPSQRGGNLLLLGATGTSLAILVDGMERMISAEDIVARDPEANELELSDGKVALLQADSLLAALRSYLPG